MLDECGPPLLSMCIPSTHPERWRPFGPVEVQPK
jgi:hypothetical protein